MGFVQAITRSNFTRSNLLKHNNRNPLQVICSQHLYLTITNLLLNIALVAWYHRALSLAMFLSFWYNALLESDSLPKLNSREI